MAGAIVNLAWGSNHQRKMTTLKRLMYSGEKQAMDRTIDDILRSLRISSPLPLSRLITPLEDWDLKVRTLLSRLIPLRLYGSKDESMPSTALPWIEMLLTKYWYCIHQDHVFHIFYSVLQFSSNSEGLYPSYSSSWLNLASIISLLFTY